jgi:hypothetical protein
MTLFEIFEKHGIDLKRENQFRNPVDILEDMYLKLNTEEYVSLMKKISETESKEGFIFDLARNKPYK